MINFGRLKVFKKDYIEGKENEEIYQLAVSGILGDEPDEMLNNLSDGDVVEVYEPVYRYRLRFIRLAQRNLLPLDTAYELYLRGYLRRPGGEFKKYQKQERDILIQKMKDEPESVETIKLDVVKFSKNGMTEPIPSDFMAIPKMNNLDVAKKYLYKTFKSDWENWERNKKEDLFRCSACEEKLPRSAFYYEKGRANGVSGYCKKCRRALEKKKYDARKSGEDTKKIDATDRTWRDELKGGRKEEKIKQEYVKKLKDRNREDEIIEEVDEEINYQDEKLEDLIIEAMEEDINREQDLIYIKMEEQLNSVNNDLVEFLGEHI